MKSDLGTDKRGFIDMTSFFSILTEPILLMQIQARVYMSFSQNQIQVTMANTHYFEVIMILRFESRYKQVTSHFLQGATHQNAQANMILHILKTTSESCMQQRGSNVEPPIFTIKIISTEITLNFSLIKNDIFTWMQYQMNFSD